MCVCVGGGGGGVLSLHYRGTVEQVEGRKLFFFLFFLKKWMIFSYKAGLN